VWRLDAFARARVLDVPAQMRQQWNLCGKPTGGDKADKGIGPVESLQCLRKLSGVFYGVTPSASLQTTIAVGLEA
jgi:hypothetical protein